jgi:hypothetical protein
MKGDDISGLGDVFGSMLTSEVEVCESVTSLSELLVQIKLLELLLSLEITSLRNRFLVFVLVIKR